MSMDDIQAKIDAGASLTREERRKFTRMGRMLREVDTLDETERTWLMQRLVAVECGDIPVSHYLRIPARWPLSQRREG